MSEMIIGLWQAVPVPLQILFKIVAIMAPLMLLVQVRQQKPIRKRGAVQLFDERIE